VHLHPGTQPLCESIPSVSHSACEYLCERLCTAEIPQRLLIIVCTGLAQMLHADTAWTDANPFNVCALKRAHFITGRYWQRWKICVLDLRLTRRLTVPAGACIMHALRRGSGHTMLSAPHAVPFGCT
jgi:hypothetical protein